MKCPKCGEELKASLDPAEEFQDHQDITLECENGHTYFVRIKEEDLIEADW